MKFIAIMKDAIRNLISAFIINEEKKTLIFITAQRTVDEERRTT